MGVCLATGMQESSGKHAAQGVPAYVLPGKKQQGLEWMPLFSITQLQTKGVETGPPGRKGMAELGAGQNPICF